MRFGVFESSAEFLDMVDNRRVVHRDGPTIISNIVNSKQYN